MIKSYSYTNIFFFSMVRYSVNSFSDILYPFVIRWTMKTLIDETLDMSFVLLFT